MAETTAIEWADATANFWIGCTKLSLACDHCYAEADWDHRKHRVKWGPHGDRSPVKAGPIVVRKMQRQAAAFIAEHGRKPRIFVNSLSDFADNHKSIQPEWREAVWKLALECPDVILMILTKRPQNLAKYLPSDWGDGYPNVWIGTTVENRAEQRRIEHLRAIPASLRFLSCEPLLEAIEPDLTGIGWVIVGGESGPSARWTHPDWARLIGELCWDAGVPFFFKQWGEWLPWSWDSPPIIKAQDGQTMDRHHLPEIDENPNWDEGWSDQTFYEHALFQKVGKKRAGRLLDGVEHSEVPSG